MANNRMFLVNPTTGARLMLAKYYPSTGWYVPTPETLGQRLNELFDSTDFRDIPPHERAARNFIMREDLPKARGGMWGERWVVEYETEPETAHL